MKDIQNKSNELLFSVHCTAHSVALIVKAASEIPHVAALMKKVNSLAARLSRSKQDRKVFKEYVGYYSVKINRCF